MWDELAVVVVDARGLVVDANRFGGVILTYALDRREFVQFIIDTPEGALWKGLRTPASAEYDVVQQRCVEYGEEQSAG